MTKYRIHFEPEDVEADDPDHAVERFRAMVQLNFGLPEVRKIFPIDNDGFAVKE